jgi:hypothetical protein
MELRAKRRPTRARECLLDNCHHGSSSVIPKRKRTARPFLTGASSKVAKTDVDSIAEIPQRNVEGTGENVEPPPEQALLSTCVTGPPPPINPSPGCSIGPMHKEDAVARDRPADTMHPPSLSLPSTVPDPSIVDLRGDEDSECSDSDDSDVMEVTLDGRSR